MRIINALFKIHAPLVNTLRDYESGASDCDDRGISESENKLVELNDEEIFKKKPEECEGR